MSVFFTEAGSCKVARVESNVTTLTRSATVKVLRSSLTTFWDKDAKVPKLPESDDIIKGTMLTRGGAVVHPQFQPAQAA